MLPGPSGRSTTIDDEVTGPGAREFPAVVLLSSNERDELLVGRAVAGLLPAGLLVAPRSLAEALDHLGADGFDALVVGLPYRHWDASSLLSCLDRPDSTPLIMIGDDPSAPGRLGAARDAIYLSRSACAGGRLELELARALARGARRRAGDPRLRRPVAGERREAAALVLTDIVGRIVRVDGELFEALGWGESDLLGRRASELFEEGERAAAEELAQRVLSGELAAYRADRRLLGVDGSARPTSSEVSVVRDAEGVASGVLIHFRGATPDSPLGPVGVDCPTTGAAEDDAVRALRDALERGELRVHYQPVMSVGGARLVGVEALVRWQHPERGLVGPGALLRVAERSNLILDVGAFVLDRALRQVARWQSTLAGFGELWVSVNLSPRELAALDPATLCAEAVASCGASPGALRLETTESAVMADVDASIAKLADVRALGVEVAIDDFGVGRSSLGHLARLPVDTLKIDQSFVQQMAPGSTSTAIVAAMASLGGSLGLELCAEGVETAEQLGLLEDLGCQFGQGFLWSRAMPADELEAWLEGGALTGRAASGTLDR